MHTDKNLVVGEIKETEENEQKEENFIQETALEEQKL
jgi:hypothetical protein